MKMIQNKLHLPKPNAHTGWDGRDEGGRRDGGGGGKRDRRMVGLNVGQLTED